LTSRIRHPAYIPARCSVTERGPRWPALSGDPKEYRRHDERSPACSRSMNPAALAAAGKRKDPFQGLRAHLRLGQGRENRRAGLQRAVRTASVTASDRHRQVSPRIHSPCLLQQGDGGMLDGSDGEIAVLALLRASVNTAGGLVG